MFLVTTWIKRINFIEVICHKPINLLISNLNSNSCNHQPTNPSIANPANCASPRAPTWSPEQSTHVYMTQSNSKAAPWSRAKTTTPRINRGSPSFILLKTEPESRASPEWASMLKASTLSGTISNYLCYFSSKIVEDNSTLVSENAFLREEVNRLSFLL